MKTGTDGYVTVKELIKELKALKNKGGGPTIKFSFNNLSIKDVVTKCEKQRFDLDESGEWTIRANQGHSTDSVKSDDLLTPIDEAFCEGKDFVHGTYEDAWKQIQVTGLSKCSRQHIHLTTGFSGEGEVKSGMRTNCQIVVHVDVKKAMQDGIKFWISKNGVILTEGDEKGVIPAKYIIKGDNLYQNRLLRKFLKVPMENINLEIYKNHKTVVGTVAKKYRVVAETSVYETGFDMHDGKLSLSDFDVDAESIEENWNVTFTLLETKKTKKR